MNNLLYWCHHHGKEVPVGKFTVCAGGMMHMGNADFSGFDTMVALTEYIPSRIWHQGFKGIKVLSYPVSDYDKADGPWPKFLEEIVQLLNGGSRILIFCDGGHGRTGMMLASLIALVEKPPDPIAVMRERYCDLALESFEQAEAVFSLMGRGLPIPYLQLPKRTEILNELFSKLKARSKPRG